MTERDDTTEQRFHVPPLPSTEPHSRVQFELDSAETREEVLGLALGAASSCWANMAGAGEFDSTQARLILTDTVTRLGQLDTPNLGLATTQELITELTARWAVFQIDLASQFQDFLSHRTVDKK